jgi:hypothetical protein
MSLDDQLRVVLNEEAELRSVPRPDVAALISGGRVRRRRRLAERGGLAAAAIVLIGAAAYGVAQVGPQHADTAPDTASVPSDAPAPPIDGRESLEPGTHESLVGYDTSGKRIEAELTVDGTGWADGDNPVVFRGLYSAGVGMYRPQLVATEPSSGCRGDWKGNPYAASPRALAGQLARLPRSTVVQPPTPTQALGHDAFHLTLRIDNECPFPEWYQPVLTTNGERGLTYSEVPAGVLVEFWVMDLDGTLVVADMWHDIGAPQDLIDQAARARDSMSILPAD